jgi:hypothetical protein
MMKINQHTIKMNAEKKKGFRMHKASILLIAAAMIIVAFIFLSPVFSQSTSPCSSCHGGYYQYLDILEVNTANQLPATLNVGATATVTIVIENKVNTARYTALSSVSLILSSQSSHFTVNAPIFSIGTLQKGTATATWQITGVSAGLDALVISANARNSHENLQFRDTYTSPALIVAGSTPTPSPTALPQPSLTAPPTLAPTTDPTNSPPATPSPTASPTTSEISTPTTTLSPLTTPTSNPPPIFATPTPSPNTKNHSIQNPNPTTKTPPITSPTLSSPPSPAPSSTFNEKNSQTIHISQVQTAIVLLFAVFVVLILKKEQ